MLEEIGSTKNIGKYLNKAKSKKDPFKLMGFGHRVYKNYDPRAKILKKICKKVLAHVGIKNDPILKLAMELEKIASDNDDTKEIFKNFVTSLGDAFSNESNFETLINKIKSPGGTTQAGLKSLEKNHLDSIFKQAFRAAKDRSIEISNEQ